MLPVKSIASRGRLLYDSLRCIAHTMQPRGRMFSASLPQLFPHSSTNVLTPQ